MGWLNDFYPIELRYRPVAVSRSRKVWFGIEIERWKMAELHKRFVVTYLGCSVTGGACFISYRKLIFPIFILKFFNNVGESILLTQRYEFVSLYMNKFPIPCHSIWKSNQKTQNKYFSREAYFLENWSKYLYLYLYKLGWYLWSSMVIVNNND